MVVATAVLVLSFLIIMDVLYSHFSTTQISQLKSELSITAHGVESGGIGWLTGLTPSGYRLTLIDEDGTVLYDTQVNASIMENHSQREEIREALETGIGESQRMSATLTEKTYYQAIRLSNGEVLRISSTQSSIVALALGMLTPVLIVLAAAIFLAAYLANRLAKRIVRPLNSLDLEHPLDNDAYEELSPLLSRIAQQHREIDRQLQKLQRMQEEFAAITGSMQEGLVLLNEKGQILSMNVAAGKLFSVSSDCTGMDFLVVERSREIQRAVGAALSGGHDEIILTRGDRKYQMDTSGILSDGKTVGAVVLSFDVTEKVQAEQLRREFTANVSHELKTPLQSILGSAELMENGLVKPEDAPRFIGHIRVEAARLMTLIDDIIRLSQLDEGDEMPFESVDLLAVAKDAASQLADMAEAKNVSLCVTGESAILSGVRRLLHEIVYNLIDNAVKYNRAGGRVTVSVAACQNFASLTVADNGIGIPQEHQERIFERFYRVDKSRSKATGGTGLGLSIVKHAVELQHGKILLTSQSGVGTTIRILFPYTEKSPLPFDE